MNNMPDLITPSKLPLTHRRIIANEFILALKRGRWMKHERIYGEMADFQIHGAHTSPNDPTLNREIVELWLSFIVYGNDKIKMPTYAAIISGTAYSKARDSLSRDGLLHSFDIVLKNRAANPYRVDTERGSYRVRKNASERVISNSQDEALLRTVNYLALHDIASDLLARFTDDVAASEDYNRVIAMAEIITSQHDL